MSSWWWIALIAVVAAALVASVVDGRARAAESRRQRRARIRTRPPGRPPVRRGAPRPRAGEIWWAAVPYEDGPGEKDRPCLVLSVRGSRVRVAKITTKHHEERPGVIALPPGTVDDARGRASFLETDEVREVRAGAFRRRAGAADPALWERVRKLA